jgi:hypothetical protein
VRKIAYWNHSRAVFPLPISWSLSQLTFPRLLSKYSHCSLTEREDQLHLEQMNGQDSHVGFSSFRSHRILYNTVLSVRHSDNVYFP